MDMETFKTFEALYKTFYHNDCTKAALDASEGIFYNEEFLTVYTLAILKSYHRWLVENGAFPSTPSSSS